jgi:murein L,D-transpeptidase YcbB/YkuD
MRHKLSVFARLLFFTAFLAASCRGRKKAIIPAHTIVEDVRSVPAVTSEQIKQIISALDVDPASVKGIKFTCLPMLIKIYEEKAFHPIWSDELLIRSQAEAFQQYLKRSAYDGLFKEDYHYDSIRRWREDLNDSLKLHDAQLWAKYDLVLTDGFLSVLQDLKQGRLQHDSLRMGNHPGSQALFFKKQLEALFNGEPADSLFSKVQPRLPGYDSLHMLLHSFVDSMDDKPYTYIKYPYKKKDPQDSILFVKSLVKRLVEEAILQKEEPLDSVQLADVIKAYQKKKKIKESGEPGNSLVTALNLTDKQKFIRLAITLDRYKAMPAEMPDQYILVNLPGFYLKLIDSDTLVLQSKIICGKPATSTPFITSAVSDMVIMPTWTVPSSIIEKEILPGLKRDPYYLSRKGLSLYNNKDEWIDPATIEWSKYKKGIPYRVVQGSGDDNALGVIKFNFDNPFAVYLHDTNQRHLFRNMMRALSHGCVRVEQWEKLAAFIARNDSLKHTGPDTLRYNRDSIMTWIARKERHVIRIRNRIPLYVRYFTCEVANGKIRFFDDVYNDDKRLAETYFQQRRQFNLH